MKLRDREMALLFCVGLVASFQEVAASPTDTLLLELSKGTVCRKGERYSVTCDYRVGDNLSFTLEGVGSKQVHLRIQTQKNHAIASAQGCVIVTILGAPGANVMAQKGAYVSTKNGRVYRTQPQCIAAKAAYVE